MDRIRGSFFDRERLESSQVYEEREIEEEVYDDLDELQDEEARYDRKMGNDI